MSWAARRRLLILITLGALVAAFVIIVSIATLYNAPSCTDGVQNQGESGVDCGSPCTYLCIANEYPPTVLFAKAFTDQSTGRTAVVASVENKNTAAAAKNISYRMTLYGANRTLIQTIPGTFDLAPGSTATIFIPGIISGGQAVVSTFLDIDSSSLKWFTMKSDPRVIPGVSNIVQNSLANTPRVDATLANGSVVPLTNVRVVVLVRDIGSNVIATSGTLVSLIPAQGSATAMFTWNNAFPVTPASIEVIPIIPLP